MGFSDCKTVGDSAQIEVRLLGQINLFSAAMALQEFDQYGLAIVLRAIDTGD